ncbi:MAG TPA: hypothetical protein VJ963_12790 [Bacteroidales bacterium]|nr:hypothetical protein [Bacteroidales bacterium]
MKKFLLWSLAFIITIAAAIYQRHTGPTYPKDLEIKANGIQYELKLVRSLSLNERPEVRLEIADTSVKARLFYKRFRTNDEYQSVNFKYKEYPVHSFVMNKIFKITEEKGLYADVPKQPEAGKIQYYFQITDAEGTQTYLKDEPVVIRFKGPVPLSILLPHVLMMFIAMLFSTLAGLMAAVRHPQYKKYALWTLILFIAGGFILGPLVQYHAFGELWTGIPFGWDLTDNKTLIAAVFWILAVFMNRKHNRPVFTILAAVVLLLVFSIPHSMFGSEFNYASGQVTQGLILNFF